ncbi:uncharacterized protein LOC6565250 [Drosophila grimshawi]|uniref:GH12763 n=1 Tax=Drosophila grimshawi TaxID=7222 RepID=B4JL09_DROGR|nr:uncharacterized protein LOC6565250 [Drosophila grimshawi]EDW00262.1 GH12763 [Drosophila grimshawi]
MRNIIKNLKDPTTTSVVLLYWLLWLCTTATTATALPKVSCTDHDTTITCDCNNDEQPLVLPQLHGTVYQVKIRNCRDLTVEPNALDNTEGLRKISFQHLDKLVLKKNALSVSRESNKALIVEFELVNFQLIDSHAISGNIEEISFTGGRIEQMHPFGFTTIKDSAILLKLDGVTINHIESQAFKKFAVEKMTIVNCNFIGNLPTRAFYELEVRNELAMLNNQFQELHSHAFSFKLISKLSLNENRFAAVDGEWLEAYIRDAVALRNNQFGATSDIAFRSLGVHRDYQLSERLELRFHNNTVRSVLPPSSSAHGADMAVASPPPQPLRFDERFALSIRQLHYDNEWDCEQLDMSAQPPQPRIEFFRQHSEQLLFRATATATATATDGGGAVAFVPMRQLIVDQCQRTNYTAYIVLGSLLLALLIVLLLLLLWWRLAQRRRRRKLDVVQPEPRTYKETQIVYQIENAGLLKTDL